MLILHHFQDTICWKSKICTLTFQGHPRSKVWALNESSHMTSYLSYLQFICLSCTILKVRYVESLKSSLWPSMVIQGQRCEHQMKGHIWLPTCLTYKLYAYLTPFLRYNMLKIWNLHFDLQGHPRSKRWHWMKAHIWLPICLTYKLYA